METVVFAQTLPSAAPLVRLVSAVERKPLNSTLVERNASTYSGFKMPPRGGPRSGSGQSASIPSSSKLRSDQSPVNVPPEKYPQ